MGLFSRKEQWERTFRLRCHHTIAKDFLSALFWLWGIVGLLFNAGALMGLTGTVGVGTSAYLTATSLVWIGGMILFGMGAMLSHNDFDGERPLAPDAGDIRVTH
ncbi:hypothetical protein [Bradyrhizobium sp. SUTN9-2]|uniref:hypothetical protein n=1 Tax=Bradyrhizobium sp. SUTN9-2 TaxID=1167456 RepID=UPI0011B232F0|nr:hypothetical protein [Bradyrhizobium sp. SUTN9-2]